MKPSPAGGSRLRGLLTRLITALVLIPVAVGAVWIGGRLFSAVVAFVAIILIFEWARIVDRAEFSRGFYTLSATAILSVFLAAGERFALAAAVAVAGGAVATVLELRRKPAVSWPLVGALTLVLPAIAVLYVRHSDPDGRALTLLLCAAVWATDSGAYLAGTFLGGPKLWPRLSPRKTWAGVIGGLLGAMVTAMVAGRLLGLPPETSMLALTGLALGGAAVIGDLVESGLKRAYGVKDTGGAFPGHGGVLDRLDGFLLAASALALLLAVRQHGGTGIAW